MRNFDTVAGVEHLNPTRRTTLGSIGTMLAVGYRGVASEVYRMAGRIEQKIRTSLVRLKIGILR